MTIPFSPPDITMQEAQEVTAALLSGWITTGARTKLFEEEIAQSCGTGKAVCLNHNTLHLYGNSQCDMSCWCHDQIR